MISSPAKPISRRGSLFMAVAGGALLAAPRLAGAADKRVLRFVPSTDVAVLDPIVTTAGVTGQHALLVFDTLYGLDAAFQPHPQMVAGHVVDDGGLTWTLTLRDGLRFHDGEKVLARDAVASVQRWGARDMYGQEVLGRANEIIALDDTRVRIRLKAPFGALPDALGKNGPSICAIMPERLAKSDPFKPVTEMIGSGPFRFVEREHLVGARLVYERFADYVPRGDGQPSRMAGPKIAHLDRVEWIVIPDAATAAAALAAGEVDWVDEIGSELAPLVRKNPSLEYHVGTDSFASILRFNWLQPPFDKPAVRRALLGAVKQSDYMIAAYGSDPAIWQTDTGFFTSNSPMANEAGIAALTGPRDMTKVRADLAAAGYAGERVVLLQPSDNPPLKALADVAADMMQQAGMNVDMQSADWGTVTQRRGNRGPLEKGGWSVFVTGLTNSIDPGGHLGLRANGAKAWFGWPDSPKLEALRQEWFAAPDVAARHGICEQMQLQAWQDVPYIPLGEYRTQSAWRRGLSGMPSGGATFWGVHWA